ncbi:MAG TPA: HAMP domain-containing sensor histidine kinase [Methylosinus sp.]|jgi:signal transduction histidine kinase|uniref:sensor histidine kinase n=1 Tax=Methylosinus sp. TaxID=427 RepID=UPI002F95FD72
MKFTQSLSARLVFYWILGSFVAYFTLPVTVFLPLSAFHIGDSSNSSLESWTTKRSKEILTGALRRGEGGALIVERTPALLRQLERNPRFRFAILERATGKLVAGSDDGLFTALGRSGVDSYSGLFHVSDDPDPNARGFVRSVDTAFGKLTIATYGALFHWDDALWQLLNFFSLNNFIAFLPLGTAAALVASLVVRRSLAPLRAATVEAAAITVDSLHKPLGAKGMPIEITPFVEAVNGAIARVEEGVAAQRRFTANAAHELRTPITVLRARVAKLDASDLKREITCDVRRIQTIVDQLLVLAQARERRCDMRLCVDLGATALKVAADFMPVAIDAKKEIAFEGPEEPIMVRGFPWAIESVLGNLVENALRAEPEGGTVIVRVGADARVDVVDHGSGVAPQDRRLIFEPFWRKEETTSGTGLGLAIVKELARELDGEIRVADTPGGGATFVVGFRPFPPRAASAIGAQQVEEAR